MYGGMGMGMGYDRMEILYIYSYERVGSAMNE